MSRITPSGSRITLSNTGFFNFEDNASKRVLKEPQEFHVRPSISVSICVENPVVRLAWWSNRYTIAFMKKKHP